MNIAFKVMQKLRPVLITVVKNIVINGQDTGVFSGFVTVQALDSGETIDYVKYTNSSLGNDVAGISYIPVAGRDCAVVGFDFRNRAYIVGMAKFDQLVKASFEETKAGPNELTDTRFKMRQGELRIRGPLKSSFYFKLDGSVVFMQDDTKEETDSSNLVVKFDQSQNVTIKNANVVSVDAQEVDVISGNVNLGNGVVKSPIVRNTDVVESIDSMGIPIFSTQYLTSSTAVKSS